MEPASSLRDRYTATIEDLLGRILGGKQIVGKQYIQRVLLEQLVPGSSELLEGCLQDQLTTLEQQIATETSEYKQSKLGHRQLALQTIAAVLVEWQQERRVSGIVSGLAQNLMAAEPDDRLGILFTAIDRNSEQPFTSEQLQQLLKELKSAPEMEELVEGLENGLAALVALEPHLVSWIYEPNRSVGFSGQEQAGPWLIWGQNSGSNVVRVVCEAIARQQPLPAFASTSAWVELAIVLQGIQVGLVRWFSQQTYDLNWGRKMSFSTLLTFGMIWSELANQAGGSNGQAGFQILLQTLRVATQRSDFPLYGGIFATFGGQSFHETLAYFDGGASPLETRPLKEVAGTQEKGRILTILAYSQSVLGQTTAALALHRQALEIASAKADRPCEIANLNHLSRLLAREKNYEEAISYAQRALISARTAGDRRGEANALVNYGYGEVLAARSREEMAEEVYEQSIGYLEQGLELAQQQDDSQSLALCYHSLASAHLALQQWTNAADYALRGMEAARAIGNSYLLGLNSYYGAEAYFGKGDPAALFYALLSLYQLHQLGVREWRSAAGLVKILQGGQDLAVAETTELTLREQLLPWIGVDGYDYLPTIMGEYEGTD
jgi:tetratricopeptide (TPR) repeat protein